MIDLWLPLIILAVVLFFILLLVGKAFYKYLEIRHVSKKVGELYEEYQRTGHPEVREMWVEATEQYQKLVG